MQTISKLLAVAAIAGVAGMAQAKTYNVGALTSFEDSFIYASKPNRDDFSDKFKFSLTESAKVSVSVSELFDPSHPSSLNLSTLDFDLFSANPLTPLTLRSPATGANPLSGSFLSGVLAAGDYFVKVSGDIAGKFGGYNIQLAAIADSGSTPAVPEPSEYLMLLAGLGVIGYAVRRKSAVN